MSISNTASLMTEAHKEGFAAGVAACVEKVKGMTRFDAIEESAWPMQTSKTGEWIYRDDAITALESLTDSAAATENGELLDCAMCNAPKSFVISPLDSAVGYCFKEQKAWRVTSTTCATKGCLRPKATFGDYCMSCLEDRVNADSAPPPVAAQQTFYVVSDVWMGRAMHVCGSREEAERSQYLETLAQHAYDEESDQTEVRLEQFRAWPAASFPHHLGFSEAFEWIGKQSVVDVNRIPPYGSAKE